MKYLFVGGPEDTRRKEVEHPRPVIQVVEWLGWRKGGKIHYYYAKEFRSDDRVFIVYFHESLKDRCAMEVIIDGYFRGQLANSR